MKLTSARTLISSLLLAGLLATACGAPGDSNEDDYYPYIGPEEEARRDTGATLRGAPEAPLAADATPSRGPEATPRGAWGMKQGRDRAGESARPR